MQYCRLKRWLLPLLLPLTACFGGGHYAPVVEGPGSQFERDNHYVVSTGDTLYSIAWRYGIDVKRLATTNGLRYPFVIYPGQTLRLRGRFVASKSASTIAAPSTSKSAPKRLTKPVTRPATSNKKPVKTIASSKPSAAIGAWRWPARGKLIRSYSAASSIHKGIDIKGKLGESVYAANSGKVVYAGSGLVGYGNLLIIKHDEFYLSAYGHNRRLLVKEGERIRVGQKIAEIGDTGTDKVKLHFEVRREGKPINPLSVLPKL